MGTQKSFLVGIEHSHKRNLGQVQPFAQQIDANQHIEEPPAQIVHDLHPFERIDIAVNIVTAHLHPLQVIRQLFGHAFGECSHQHALVGCGTLCNFFHQVVDLVEAGTHFDDRVEKSRRPDKLLNDYSLTLHQLIIGRGSTHIDRARRQRFELLEGLRTVIQRSRKTETVFNERLFARTVSAVHGAYLGHRYMALINDQQKIFRKIV